ncbi:uncharacterized protein isoform X3 [Rhodnius prolixus]
MSNSLQVRCLVCGELLSYSRECTDPLIEHLRNKHPYIHVAKIPPFPRNYNLNNTYGNLLSEGHEKNLLLGNKESYKKEARKKSKENQNKIVTGKIYCPSCECESEPVIRKQKNPLTNSAIGTFFMLGCWPFCFLPFFVWGTRVVSLYCPKCSQLLGTFDRKLNIMIKRPSAENPAASKLNPKVSSSTSAPNLNYNK